jgi:transposase
MEHIGIDVHKRESQVCVLGEGGEVVLERRIATQRERLAELLGKRPKARVLLESSTESEWVARCLEELGHEVVVADPNFAAMYATRSRRVKTDKRDARTLAEASRLGAYRPAHRISDERRGLRAQVAAREVLVRTRTRLLNQVGAQLRQEGLRVGTGDSEYFAQRVAALTLPERLQAQVAPLLAVLKQVNEQVAALDEALEQLCRQDEQLRRLCTVPYVGPVTACAFASAVDNPERFGRAHQVEAYLGLVPSESSSGEQQHKGRITKAGNTRVRWLLVEAGMKWLWHPRPETEWLRVWAQGIAARSGKKKAVVALARRLSGILFAMMRDGTEYRAPKREAQEAAA